MPYQKLIPRLGIPIFPGLAWNGGSWSGSLIKQSKIQKEVRDFFAYNGHGTSRGDYTLLEDVDGPMYMLPGDCLKVKSFQVP